MLAETLGPPAQVSTLRCLSAVGYNGRLKYCLLICYRTERQKLYQAWQKDLKSDWQEELKLAMREYEDAKENQRRIHADADLTVLREARYVGMTTAGVASHQDSVAAMGPKA